MSGVSGKWPAIGAAASRTSGADASDSAWSGLVPATHAHELATEARAVTWQHSRHNARHNEHTCETNFLSQLLCLLLQIGDVFYCRSKYAALVVLGAAVRIAQLRTKLVNLLANPAHAALLAGVVGEPPTRRSLGAGLPACSMEGGGVSSRRW